MALDQDIAVDTFFGIGSVIQFCNNAQLKPDLTPV